MPSFTRAFGGGAFVNNGAYCTDDYAGAALWLPPNVHPADEALGELMERTVSATIRGDLFAIFEQMAGHHPSEPHWYLPLIGVDPAHQGKGYGSALMTYALRQCDRDHLPAYLESTNPRNVSLYRRHGFEVVGTIQVGSSPLSFRCCDNRAERPRGPSNTGLQLTAHDREAPQPQPHVGPTRE